MNGRSASAMLPTGIEPLLYLALNITQQTQPQIKHLCRQAKGLLGMGKTDLDLVHIKHLTRQIKQHTIPPVPNLSLEA